MEEGVIMSTVILSDEDLVERVVRVIQERTGRMVRGLRVEVEAGQVILFGFSPSYYYKQLASHAAMEELAGQNLANEIQVVDR